jgi:hypothetical protein
MKRRGDRFRRVWFRKENSTLGQVSVAKGHLTGRRNDLDRRPFAPDIVRELQPNHGTGHLDIGKDDTNVRPCFEDRNCFVALPALTTSNPVSSISGCVLSQQKFVFDD